MSYTIARMHGQPALRKFKVGAEQFGYVYEEEFYFEKDGRSYVIVIGEHMDDFQLLSVD